MPFLPFPPFPLATESQLNLPIQHYPSKQDVYSISTVPRHTFFSECDLRPWVYMLAVSSVHFKSLSATPLIPRMYPLRRNKHYRVFGNWKN